METPPPGPRPLASLLRQAHGSRPGPVTRGRQVGQRYVTNRDCSTGHYNRRHAENCDGGLCLDLPGVNAESIDLTVEQNVLTVRAERAPVQADGAEMIVAERPYGTFTRQVFLGETLDAENIAADYAAGVLTLTIPVREAAKPRSIHVTSSDTKQAVTA